MDPGHPPVRRRLTVALTLAAGTALLWWSLGTRPGDPVFYGSTAALAATWAGGALLSGALPLARERTGRGTAYARQVVPAVCLGLVLVALFLAGALLVARVPALAGPVDDLLDHARLGALPLVLLLTVVTGVSEELFFRGALYAALPPRWAVAGTTVVYTLVTVVSGVPLLVLAAAVLGLVCGRQRQVTGGVLAPAVTHVTWSAGLLLLLPPVLNLLR